jgi:hypothetical protein
MSRFFLLSSLVLMVACGEKKAPEPAPAAAAPPPPPPAPVVEEPAPPPAPVEVTNADLNVTLTMADGSSKSGHVKRVERSSNFRGDEDWLTDSGELKIAGEAPGAYKKFTWDQVQSVSIKPAPASTSNISCTYSSEYNPWVYECTIKAPSTLTAKEGGTFTVDTGYKWRFVFDDDSEVEFYMKKYIVWEQDSEEVGLDTVNPENYDLYGKLQQRLKADVKGAGLVTRIEIQ